MSTTLIDGTAVSFGKEKWVVPALNRKLLKKHADKFEFFQNPANAPHGGNALEIFDLQCDMVFDALKLNYPNLSQDDFDEKIDMLNMQVAFPACLGNLVDAAEAQAKNARAVSHSGSLTGTQTPPASLPGQAGASTPAGG